MARHTAEGRDRTAPAPADDDEIDRRALPAPEDVTSTRTTPLVAPRSEIEAALATGEQVKLSGFGNFDLRDKNQRPGRNPKTGEEIPISARRVVTFRPGQKLKARVEAYAGSK